MASILRFATSLFISLLCANLASAQPGRLAAIGDEWPISDEAFSAVGDNARNLTLNLATFLTGGPTGDIAIFGATPRVGTTMFPEALTQSGYNITRDPPAGYSLQTMRQYDGVIIGGRLADDVAPATDPLLQYINGGGSVLIIGGSGVFEDEAAQWNPLLNAFGLSFGGDHFHDILGADPVPLQASTHPAAANVTQLLWGFGQNVTKINPDDAQTDLIIADFTSFGFGLEPVIGTFQIPEPNLGLMLLSATLAIRTRSKRNPKKG